MSEKDICKSVAFTGCLQAAYLRVPEKAKARLAEAGMQEQYREGLHAAMHAMLNVLPLHVICGEGDVGAECDNPYSARFRPDRLLLFDRCPGGIGLAYRVTPFPTAFSYGVHRCSLKGWGEGGLRRKAVGIHICLRSLCPFQCKSAKARVKRALCFLSDSF